MTEERCRALVERLCSGLGWSVRPAPGVRCVLFDQKGRWITFGQSMAWLVASLCDWSYSDILPAWMQRCSSPEELALKAEVAL